MNHLNADGILCIIYYIWQEFLPLDAGSGSAHDGFDLAAVCHGGVAGRGHGERAVGCAVVDGKLRIAGGHEAEDEA